MDRFESDRRHFIGSTQTAVFGVRQLVQALPHSNRVVGNMKDFLMFIVANSDRTIALLVSDAFDATPR